MSSRFANFLHSPRAPAARKAPRRAATSQEAALFKLLNMTRVAECSVTECAYNTGRACHAIAITVGSSDLPMCDTFFVAREHSGDQGHAGVGACKMSGCLHNRELECSAGRVLIGKLEARVRCITYVPG